MGACVRIYDNAAQPLSSQLKGSICGDRSCLCSVHSETCGLLQPLLDNLRNVSPEARPCIGCLHPSDTAHACPSRDTPPHYPSGKAQSPHVIAPELNSSINRQHAGTL